MDRIASRQNPIVRQFRAVANGTADGILLDGEHLLQEALDALLPVDIVALREDLRAGPAAALALRAEARGVRVVAVTHSVLSAISPVKQPSGIVALAQRREVPLDTALAHPPQMVMMLSDIQDPGNVGAIIRAADACGVTGIVSSRCTADPFGWKALRGSMGSAFRVPIAANCRLESAVAAAKGRGLRVYAAIPRGGAPLPRCDLRDPFGILLGSEGAGLPDGLVDAADERVSIPMRATVESLNVATAAALVAYEALRQREGFTQ